jgi:sugar phosphate isomerase/epimerase
MRLALDWWSYHNSLVTGAVTPEAMIRRGAELGATGVLLEYFALPAAWRANPIKLLELQSEFRLTYGLGFGLPLTASRSVWDAMHESRKAFWKLAAKLRVQTVHAIPGISVSATMVGIAVPKLLGRFSLRAAAHRLRDFCVEAAERELTVTVANHGALGIDRLLWLVDRVDRPNLRVALNTGQALVQREDPYRLIDRFAQRAATVLLQDRIGHGVRSKARPIGDGQIDFEEIRRILTRHHFDGLCAVSIDLPVWAGRDEDAWVEKSFVHLASLREAVLGETTL